MITLIYAKKELENQKLLKWMMLSSEKKNFYKGNYFNGRNQI